MSEAANQDATAASQNTIFDMSAFLDKADQIADHLKTIPALSSVEILVDRQKDMPSEFAKAMGKAKGGVVIIFFSGYTPNDEEVAESVLISSFSVTIWTKPILRSSQPKADDLVEAVHRALHGWKHDFYCQHNAIVRRGRIVPNDRFLIHELELELKHELPIPE